MSSHYQPSCYRSNDFRPSASTRCYGTLFAQISPTNDLIELNKKRQKIYSSLEVRGDFAATGKAYLVGLAVTDSPASLGTEVLEFAAKKRAATLGFPGKLNIDDFVDGGRQFKLLDAEENTARGCSSSYGLCDKGASA